MKKRDVLNAIDPKKKSSTKKKTTKNTTKKINTKKKTPVKKKTTTQKIEKKPIVQEIKNTNIDKESHVKQEKKVEKEYETEEVVLPFKKRFLRFVLKTCIFIIIIVILYLIFLFITEYRPKDKESVDITGEGFYSLNLQDPITVMTWDIGYGALGDNADYYKEGGKMVQTADRNRLNRNLNDIRTKIDEVKPNIIFLQEVDISSKRASHVDELSSFQHHLNSYSATYATNLKTSYLPYPIFNSIGKVYSGIATLSKFTIESAYRVQLPSDYIWPKSMVNYKRCLLINYIPIKDSDKKLVLINVHFDDSTHTKGRKLQTEKLIEIIKKELKKDNYVIVGGDFNQTFSNVDLSKYPLDDQYWKPGEIDTSKFNEHFQLLMDSEKPSCRSLDKPYEGADMEKFQYYIIDGYIVSDNIEVSSVQTQDYGFVVSDHNPVVLKVTLK